MNNLVATRLNGVKPSASSHAAQRARDLAASGVEVISLATGEPDFETPPHVIEAAHAAMLSGDTKYTRVGGTPAMIKAIALKFRRDNGLDYKASELIAAPGTKNLIFLALMATLNPGDEVIVPAPHWVSYTDMTKLVGGAPVVVSCTQNNAYKLDAAALQGAITPRTRWVMLNTPNNPTGAVYSKQDLEDLAEVLRQHPRVMMMSDEIYEHILFDGRKFHSFAAVAPDLKDRTLTLNGVSKAYAMTGWRIGFGGGAAPLISAMNEVQSQTSGSICTLSQAGAVAALTGPQDYLAERAAAFQERRDLVIPLLDAVPGLRCHRPEGAFYLFVDCGGLLGLRSSGGATLQSDSDVAEYLLEAARVVVVAGGAYGLSPHIRLSIASPTDKLRIACDRIAGAVARLMPN